MADETTQDPTQQTDETAQQARPEDQDAPRAAEAQPDAPEGEPAEEADDSTGEPAAEGAEHPDTILAAERLADLQRAQADLVNYRNRMERLRAQDKDNTIAGVVEALIPVLDDIHMARQAGDLEGGPFAAIATKLEGVLERYGVESIGEVGETFDPNHHEALLHTEGDLPEGATETTVVQVLQPGFRVNKRIVRAARVAVADPS
ncbi:molecular chaperone GrpE [Kytococcus aerolatus]|uniref:Protein GrpE n=1 Tax=Kytococcus aerolatus TaxID=592308 RepID=A0A212U5I6_9MICO|nr:nucleotide exchange factor GrpE [Kytococcus aerolatus]SNC73344.1 molecular chaperone GrpE [Kytococcus aerolatus]